MDVAQGTDSEAHAGAKAAGLVLWTEDGEILVGRGATKREWSEPGGQRERGEPAAERAERRGPAAEDARRLHWAAAVDTHAASMHT